MKLKVCVGPLCDGMEQFYDAFEIDAEQPDLLSVECKKCMKERRRRGGEVKNEEDFKVDMQNVKVCKGCGMSKPVEKFGQSKSFLSANNPEGIEANCLVCRRAKQLAKYAERTGVKDRKPAKPKRKKRGRGKARASSTSSPPAGSTPTGRFTDVEMGAMWRIAQGGGIDRGQGSGPAGDAEGAADRAAGGGE